MDRKVFTFLFLIALSVGCNQNAVPSATTLPFNGTLTASDGQSPSQSAGVSYSNFQQRKALLITAQTDLKYKLNQPNLNSGSLEFWIKVYPVPLTKSLKFLRLQIGTQDLILSIDENKIQALFQTSKFGELAEQGELTRGTWTFVMLSWKSGMLSRPEVLLACNGAPPAKSHEAQPRAKNEERLNAFRIHFQDTNPAGAEILLRDLRWSTEFHEPDSSRYSSDENLPLTFRAKDLNHFSGKEISDPDATGRAAWGSDSMMVRESAVSLPAAGTYELIYRIKPAEPLLKNEIWSKVWNLQNKTEISTIRNSAQDFARANLFGTFTQNFRVAEKASIGYEFRTSLIEKHQFIIDTVTLRHLESKWEHVVRAEDLEHGMGSWQADSESVKGKGWTNGGPLTFGPYTCIGQPGKYRATWRIKIDSSIPANQKILALDIFAHDSYFPKGRRTKIYSRGSYTSDDFPRDRWATQSIDFHYDGADQLEFRTFAFLSDTGAIRVDTISVERLR